MIRLALSALLATAALFGVTPLASAHTELVSSDPANGATLSQRPAQLTLTFSEPVPAESATITLTGPDGSNWPMGEVNAQGPTLTIPLKESGSPAGEHTVNWMVESLDGDFVDGKLVFTLPAPPAGQAPPTTTAPAVTTTTPPTTTDAPAETTTAAGTTTAEATTTTTSAPAVAGNTAGTEDDGGVPLWVWILAAVVLVAIGGAVAAKLAKRDADVPAGAGPDDAGPGDAGPGDAGPGDATQRIDDQRP